MAYFGNKEKIEKEMAKIENETEKTAEISLPEETKQDYMYLEGVQQLIVKVRSDMIAKASNPSAIQDANLAMAYIKGEPFMAIDDKYVPLEKAQIILQREKVVMEYLKLKKLMKNYEDNK